MPRQDTLCCAGTLRKEDVWTQSRHSLEDAIKTEQQQGAVSEQKSDEERLRERLDNLKLVMHVMGSDGACLVSRCALWCTTCTQWRLLVKGCGQQGLGASVRAVRAHATPSRQMRVVAGFGQAQGHACHWQQQRLPGECGVGKSPASHAHHGACFFEDATGRGSGELLVLQGLRMNHHPMGLTAPAW